MWTPSFSKKWNPDGKVLFNIFSKSWIFNAEPRYISTVMSQEGVKDSVWRLPSCS